jgi:hypothetical protein
MQNAIFIHPVGGQPIRLTPAHYSAEADFQDLLSRYPDLLAGDQIDRENPRRWLLVDAEVGIAGEEGGSDRWSLDHLFVDQDAIPTLVEVKRKSDTRLRREVVGQMMDYAANATVYWPGSALRDGFEKRCLAAGEDPADLFAAFAGDESDYDAFWETAVANLREGRVRLLFVADEIPGELQRVVEFLNERMSPTEVLATEIRRYAGEGYTTHIPRLFGHTAEAAQRKSRRTRSSRVSEDLLDERQYLELVEKRGGAALASGVARVLEWLRATPTIRYRITETPYNLTLKSQLELSGGAPYFLRIFGPDAGEDQRRIEYSIHQYPPFDHPDLLEEFRARLSRIPTLSMSVEELARSKSIPSAVLEDEAAVETLVEVLGWALQEIVAVEPNAV